MANFVELVHCVPMLSRQPFGTEQINSYGVSSKCMCYSNCGCLHDCGQVGMQNMHVVDMMCADLCCKPH